MRQLTRAGCLQLYNLAISYAADKLLLIPHEFSSCLLNKVSFLVFYNAGDMAKTAKLTSGNFLSSGYCLSDTNARERIA